MGRGHFVQSCRQKIIFHYWWISRSSPQLIIWSINCQKLVENVHHSFSKDYSLSIFEHILWDLESSVWHVVLPSCPGCHTVMRNMLSWRKSSLHIPPQPSKSNAPRWRSEIHHLYGLYGLFGDETWPRGFSPERSEGSVTCSTSTLWMQKCQ